MSFWLSMKKCGPSIVVCASQIEVSIGFSRTLKRCLTCFKNGGTKRERETSWAWVVVVVVKWSACLPSTLSLNPAEVYKVYIFSAKINKNRPGMVHLKRERQRGPWWWWSSGQRACILIWWSEFESRRSLQLSYKIDVEKNAKEVVNQMARLFVQYLAINSHENLPNSVIFCQSRFNILPNTK